MVPHNLERHRTAYTHTVDYLPGTTTGISAHDRALTVRALASPSPSPASSSSGVPAVTARSFTRPGHMVPLRAREGGVVRREGGVRAREARDALLELVDERGLVGEGGGGEAFDHWG